jgi:hypothetical protein
MLEAYDKIAAGLRDAIVKAPIDPAVADAMGEVIASMMKRDNLEHYRRERDAMGAVTEDDTGHYLGCIAESEEMIRRLRRRGFDIVKLENPHA